MWVSEIQNLSTGNLPYYSWCLGERWCSDPFILGRFAPQPRHIDHRHAGYQSFTQFIQMFVLLLAALAHKTYHSSNCLGYIQRKTVKTKCERVISGNKRYCWAIQHKHTKNMAKSSTEKKIFCTHNQLSMLLFRTEEKKILSTGESSQFLQNCDLSLISVKICLLK